MSKIILGTAQFGMDYGINNVRGKIPYNEVVEILNFAYKNGIDTLDTAYSYGESEEILGKAISNSSLKFNIISKLPDLENDKNVENIFNETLKRLRQKKLYGYLFHNFETFRKHPYIYNIFQELKCSNKVEKIGFSIYYPSEIDYLLDNKIDFDIVQIPYSIFDQRFENYLHLLKEKKIEVHIRSVFLQGLFFKKPDELSENFVKIREDLENINKISKRLNISIASLCIKFALMNENIDKIIIGIDSLEDLVENIRGINGNKIADKYFKLLRNMRVDDETIILPFRWGFLK
ncbi:MAG: aldo/keto reductase [Candidatus Methanofastidiosum sp.]|nr:aldo/keto reductase [Methanofastidiosum sp.]HQF37067.1 aldo/keto reductase [Candidatus Dojkabacteria bacterium]